MTVPITIESKFMMHESGSKFYEIITLNAADIGQHIVVKRWGKASAQNGGGEIQVHTYPSARKAGAAADTVKRQKEGRGYAHQAGGPGLNSFGGQLTSGNVAHFLETHYGKNNARAILSNFNDERIRGLQATTMVLDEASDIVSEEPVPEPERGNRGVAGEDTCAAIERTASNPAEITLHYQSAMN